KGTLVEKLVEETARDAQHLRNLISICEAQRQVGETALNDTSSRSQQIIRLAFGNSSIQDLVYYSIVFMQTTEQQVRGWDKVCDESTSAHMIIDLVNLRFCIDGRGEKTQKASEDRLAFVLSNLFLSPTFTKAIMRAAALCLKVGERKRFDRTKASLCSDAFCVFSLFRLIASDSVTIIIRNAADMMRNIDFIQDRVP
ncbi:kinesin-like protein NACK1, partial [Tanacetum coccineum]